MSQTTNNMSFRTSHSNGQKPHRGRGDLTTQLPPPHLLLDGMDKQKDRNSSMMEGASVSFGGQGITSAAILAAMRALQAKIQTLEGENASLRKQLEEQKDLSRRLYGSGGKDTREPKEEEKQEKKGWAENHGLHQKLRETEMELENTTKKGELFFCAQVREKEAKEVGHARKEDERYQNEAITRKSAVAIENRVIIKINTYKSNPITARADIIKVKHSKAELKIHEIAQKLDEMARGAAKVRRRLEQESLEKECLRNINRALEHQIKLMDREKVKLERTVARLTPKPAKLSRSRSSRDVHSRGAGTRRTVHFSQSSISRRRRLVRSRSQTGRLSARKASSCSRRKKAITSRSKTSSSKSPRLSGILRNKTSAESSRDSINFTCESLDAVLRQYEKDQRRPEYRYRVMSCWDAGERETSSDVYDTVEGSTSHNDQSQLFKGGARKDTGNSPPNLSTVVKLLQEELWEMNRSYARLLADRTKLDKSKAGFPIGASLKAMMKKIQTKTYQLRLLYAHEENSNREIPDSPEAESDVKGESALFSSTSSAYPQVGNKGGHNDKVCNEEFGLRSKNEGASMRRDFEFGTFTERAVPVPTPR
eukprot:jgi/Bigna1/84000/fgenesh1_pg.120_\